MGKLTIRMDNRDDLQIECDEAAAKLVLDALSDPSEVLTINMSSGTYVFVKSKISTIAWTPRRDFTATKPN